MSSEYYNDINRTIKSESEYSKGKEIEGQEEKKPKREKQHADSQAS